MKENRGHRTRFKPGAAVPVFLFAAEGPKAVPLTRRLVRALYSSSNAPVVQWLYTGGGRAGSTLRACHFTRLLYSNSNAPVYNR